MVESIATERLLLRRARAEDATPLHAIMRDPHAMRFWSTLPHAGMADTEAFVASMMAPPHDGSDDFIVEADGRVIGKLGAWRLPEVGYLLSPGVWGRGYASEALAAFIAHRRRCGSQELTADTDPRNEASMRLLRRHGFIETGRAERTWLIGGEWFDSVYWRLGL
ncbi:GNAT family N-acetyltransferase [Sphingomonas sp. BN140010]|uniref:GNAT family N-acetyltransferase n=1 Tax=Sphingomonas arvum TaxID=2992113 RepID=A0ABT3JDU8_9SPHN|nr:GNAT family protein [Sphingomonas sp. BN140010]MCW3797237.1 GNAT family N-acetyltransferase [Sphingomonas sp. BN140010]